MRPTVHDIARRAGVSLATVDRVLNARAGVRQATIARVQAAIDELGYVRDSAAANLARQKRWEFAFVLPSLATGLFDAMRRELAALQARALVERTLIRVVDVPPDDTPRLAAALEALAAAGVDGVAVLAPETPQARDALRRLHEAGVRMVTLGTDLPGSGRDHFVGIDNIAAGRTAAILMGRFLGPGGGKVAVLAGSMLARLHAERRFGFDRVMLAEFPDLEVLPSLEGRDDAELIAGLVPAALAAEPGIRGIYATGSGHRGLVAALRRLPPGRRPVVIAHDLTPRARLALADGIYDAVISQDVGHMMRSAVRVLRAKAEGQEIVAAQERIRIDIFLKENLP